MIRESFDESYQEKTKVFRKHLAILKFLFKISQFKFLSHDREKHLFFVIKYFRYFFCKNWNPPFRATTLKIEILSNLAFPK